ncbi:MAG: branched-chain amino acid ABC transporter permease [Halobacteria archaeon]
MSFAQFIVNGLLTGGVYAAVAVGFALIWGVVGVINLAHGEMVILGGYVTFWLTETVSGGGEPGLLVALATVPVVFVALFFVGYIIHLAVVERVAGKDMFLSLVATFGLSIVIQQLMIQAWSANTRTISIAFDDPSFIVAGVVFPKLKLITFCVAVLLTLFLWIYLHKTKKGRGIRAVSQNPEAAKFVGIDVGRIRAFTFGISSAVAGAAGGLIAMTLSINPNMGLNYTFRSFIIVVFGGIGSVTGSLLGGLGLAEIEQLTDAYIGNTWSLTAVFLALVFLIVVKPTGLFGSGEVEK